jgi:2-dehydro-3-deoxygalactonokinase
MTEPAMAKPALIALDWGTSSFRAFLLTADGQILERNEKGRGILHLGEESFEQVFEAATRPWVEAHGPLPAIAAGMIGSRQGWTEAPYVECPAEKASLAAGLIKVGASSGRDLWIVPGLSMTTTGEAPDVVRGEETQIFGAAALRGLESGLFVTPGTHSKWAFLEAGRIVWFATFMTGEMFAVLCKHSILGRLMTEGDHDAGAFRRGLDAAQGNPMLLNSLFSTRTLGLFQQIPASGLRSYLSGLLIGQEINEASGLLNKLGRSVPQEATLIGSASLSPLYAVALEKAGVTSTAIGDEATIKGLAAIARTAGLLEPSAES